MRSVVTVAGELLCHNTVQKAVEKISLLIPSALVFRIIFTSCYLCFDLLVTGMQEVPSSALEVQHREQNTKECVNVAVTRQ